VSQPDVCPREPANDIETLALVPVPSAAATRGLWARVASRFVSTYLTADTRSLGAGRIVLASVLLLDLVKRWVQLGSWYTNDGLIPNHTLLWRPSFAHVFSFFYMASYTHEAALGFVVCAVAYSALLVGLGTRVAQAASVVCVMSLHGRVLLFDNGGDVVLGLLAIWTAFVPTGERFSIDAVLRRRPPRSASSGWACSRSPASSRSSTSSTPFTRTARPGARARRCTTCCTWIAS
jgi:hypothetical protein